MNLAERKPWLEYPELWKTEAEWWSFLRGCLRRGLWEKSAIKLKFKNDVCGPPPPEYTGRAKSGAYCALSGEWTGKSAGEIDHIEGHKSLLCWEDVLPFINHLVPERDSLQFVNKEAHKIKSLAERLGISFQEARYHKQAIALQKSKQDISWLKSKGIQPGSNQTIRRKQVVDKLREEDGE